MGKFQFGNNNVHLDIDGHQYTIPGTIEYAAKIKRFGQEARARAEQLQTRTDETSALDEAIEFVYESIDKIIGDGASKEIFSGREKNLYDCLDVIQYITNEFADFQMRKQTEIGGALKSRAQRKPK